MTKTAWIFPGQGSQEIGMGLDLAAIPHAQARFELAEQILGWSVLDLCQKDLETLSKTFYTQPCLYVIESILTDLLQAQGQTPDLVAGHSLGEYSALYAAKVFDFATGLRLVQRRAQLMDSAAGGKMVALIGFNREQLETALNQTPGVSLANDNSEAQVVITGEPEAVEQILAQVKVKRAVPLNVSAAFHSPFMAQPAAEFNQVLDSVKFENAQVPILSNVEPEPATNAEIIKARLARQMTGSVRWREISEQLSSLEVTQVIEIGPGKVLTGLIKRTYPDIALVNISKAEQIFGEVA